MSRVVVFLPHHFSAMDYPERCCQLESNAHCSRVLINVQPGATIEPLLRSIGQNPYISELSITFEPRLGDERTLQVTKMISSLSKFLQDCVSLCHLEVSLKKKVTANEENIHSLFFVVSQSCLRKFTFSGLPLPICSLEPLLLSKLEVLNLGENTVDSLSSSQVLELWRNVGAAQISSSLRRLCAAVSDENFGSWCEGLTISPMRIEFVSLKSVSDLDEEKLKHITQLVAANTSLQGMHFLMPVKERPDPSSLLSAFEHNTNLIHWILERTPSVAFYYMKEVEPFLRRNMNDNGQALNYNVSCLQAALEFAK